MYESELAHLLQEVRARRPLVHHITNYVTVNDCANVTLCIGAAPVMAEAREEVEEMVSLADAVVLNIGTLRSEQVDSMLLAGRRANGLGIPVVLDPVGAGATKYRTEVVQRLLDGIEVAVLKGNAGEIGVIAGTGGKVRGVDSAGATGSATDVTTELANRIKATVVISGPTDTISDGRRTLLVDNGHELMGRVSGTGCMAASLVGAFAGVADDRALASAAALASFGLAGERAAEKASGPASFKVALLDEIAGLAPSDLQRGAKVREVPR